MKRNVSTLFNLREKEIKENLAQVENGIFSNTSDRIFYNVFFFNNIFTVGEFGFVFSIK